MKELGRMRVGTMATLVNRNCVLCSNDALCPALLWFGSGGFAPCVRGASGQVVGLNSESSLVVGGGERGALS